MKHGKLTITYNTETPEGKMIERLKNGNSNLSPKIRDLLWIVYGGEFLEDTNAPQEKIKRHCLTSIDFLAGKTELARAILQINNASGNCDRSSIQIRERRSRAIIKGLESGKASKSPAARNNPIAKSLAI